jgi:predicted O-linked N-acetylglucosamine transferase (SPINDLY family)
MGNAHLRLGQPEASVIAYRQALALKADFADAAVALGGALEDLGQHDAAIESYQQALKIKPDYAEVHFNLGRVLAAIGQLNNAVSSYRRALAIRPDYAEAHNDLGNLLRNIGDMKGAVASYLRALEIRPGDVETNNSLGNAQQSLGQFADAVMSYRRALDLKPDYVEALSNQGVALHELGRLDDAVACYHRALSINPDDAETHMNLGCVLKDYGQYDAALASVRRALEIKPDYTVAQDNLLFIHTYLAEQPASLLLAEARHYGEMVARQARPYTVWDNVPEPARSLRVGLLSADLRQHPVGNFLEGVLAIFKAHTSSRLEFFAYPCAICNDEVSERIKACCRGWHSVLGISDDRLAQRIRDDGIDILIDLSGHTGHNRLPVFAWKPAPVQVAWLGYLATTGVTAMDYLIADAWTLPETEERYFTEKIWRLPESYLCFTPPNVNMDVSPLPALASGRITFGSFNNLAKMNDAVVALWARILAAVPASRLLLKAAQLKEPSVRQSIVERFAACHIKAEQLIFMDIVPRTEYLAPYQQVDIALDPFPYPGITTSVEALWAGVPVLTLAGESFLARQGVGLLMNAGLPDWIATDPEDYVARAVLHASDLQSLAALRVGLRQQVLASPIFDAEGFAQHFEAALCGMWEKWCAEHGNLGTN